MATEQFDVTIIGSGPGGYVAAVRAGQLGLKTALVEKDKRLGGTCTLRGCIPTKQLLMSAHVYEQMQHAADFGVRASDIQLAFADVQKRKERVVTKNSKGIEYLMKKNKITVFKGTGKLALPGKVEVTGDDGKTETINTKNIIIATGSVVRPIPGFETDGVRVVNSDHILELKDVPKSLIVMGAGAVGVEFASVYSRFGTDTTIVELLPHLLPLEDEEVSTELEKSFRKRGIKYSTGTRLEKMEQTDTGVVVTGKNAKGEDVRLEAEMFLVAVGRMPYLQGLGLEGTKIKVERGTVQVDEYCRTGEPNVYAIGDVIPTPWLAHLASKEGILVVEQIAGQKPHPINLRHVPSCTYCDPEVASVGLTEAAATEGGLRREDRQVPVLRVGQGAHPRRRRRLRQGHQRSEVRRVVGRPHHRPARDRVDRQRGRRAATRIDRRRTGTHHLRAPHHLRSRHGSRRRRPRLDDTYLAVSYQRSAFSFGCKQS